MSIITDSYKKTIRASMLPAYNDCPRRTVCRYFRKEIEAAGYLLNRQPPNISLFVGTATHEVIETYLNAKIDHTNFNIEDALHIASIFLEKQVKDGVAWDDATKSLEQAIAQIDIMASAYIYYIGEHITPLATEIRMTADINPFWQISGQIDVLAKTENKDNAVTIRDLKTGKMAHSYYPQLGAYSLLYKSNPPENYPKNITDIFVDFMKKPTPKKQEMYAETIHYDINACEINAYAIIQRIISDVDKFLETKDYNAFPENIMSMLCSETYCDAYCTDFCPLSKLKQAYKGEKNVYSAEPKPSDAEPTEPTTEPKPTVESEPKRTSKRSKSTGDTEPTEQVSEPTAEPKPDIPPISTTTATT